METAKHTTSAIYHAILSGPGQELNLHLSLQSRSNVILNLWPEKLSSSAIIRAAAQIIEQCQVVVFIADDLGFLGPGSPDLMTELCPLQDAA